MSAKFKIGDKVKCTKKWYPQKSGYYTSNRCSMRVGDRGVIKDKIASYYAGRSYCIYLIVVTDSAKRTSNVIATAGSLTLANCDKVSDAPEKAYRELSPLELEVIKLMRKGTTFFEINRGDKCEGRVMAFVNKSDAADVYVEWISSVSEEQHKKMFGHYPEEDYAVVLDQVVSVAIPDSVST